MKPCFLPNPGHIPFRRTRCVETYPCFTQLHNDDEHTKIKNQKNSRGVEPEILTGRETKIAILAFFRAERRNFAPGHEMEDWFAAAQKYAEIENNN